jgi:hypothetical protein
MAYAITNPDRITFKILLLCDVKSGNHVILKGNNVTNVLAFIILK